MLCQLQDQAGAAGLQDGVQLKGTPGHPIVQKPPIAHSTLCHSMGRYAYVLCAAILCAVALFMQIAF